MKMNVEKQIEFDKIKEMWMRLATTLWAKDKIREKTVCLDEAALRKQLKDTTDSRDFLEKSGTPPLQNLSEIKEILTIAQTGDCLTPWQLERVENILVMISRLKKYLQGGKAYGNPLDRKSVV